MIPLVTWVADLLLAAWQRQEHEGRYRGADDFRALHIDPADALASWRATTTEQIGWPEPLAEGFAAVGFPPGLGLNPAERLVASLAVAVELEPRLRPLVAALTDDPTLHLPTVGLAAEAAGAVGLPASAVRAAVAPEGRLDVLDLVRTAPVAGRPSRLDAQLLASDWLVEATDTPDAAEFAGAEREWVSAGPGRRRSARVPRLISGADHRRHAEEAAAEGSGLAVVVRNPEPDALGASVRAALLRDAALVIAADAVPGDALARAVELAVGLGCPVALSLAPGVAWVAPARWATSVLAPAGPPERGLRWADALARAGLSADDRTLDTVAHEYALGLDAIEQAVQRIAAQPVAQPVPLATLRAAARRTAWRDLSTCARPGPSGNSWDDLVVTPGVRAQLHDVAAAISERGRVLDEWGFGARPGSRGYHVLFAGPSGTGKTMSAGVIAEATGLELWVVDLARVVDKYLGETEKALDRVLRAAESSGAMLLFDEADALFGRRGEVKEAKDRWANVEVAFLLQRIEEHDGVTVLTTNVSHHLDEAFARRMSQRVEFTVPDARLRRTLWRRSMPAGAPLADDQDLATVADHFELAGGAIRTAALNAAYEAAAAGGSIGLGQLVRAGVRELSKAGRTPTRADLGELGVHLGELA